MSRSFEVMIQLIYIYYKNSFSFYSSICGKKEMNIEGIGKREPLYCDILD